MALTYEDMLNNQLGYAGRYAGTGSTVESPEYTGMKGNPFFTATNQPGQTSVTTSTRAPFTWSGSNDSLRSQYEAAYNSYWAGVPSTSTHNLTWEGPEIRPIYEQQDGGFGQNYDSLPTGISQIGQTQGQRPASTGLQNIGTRNYWQDNNRNAVYNPLEDDAFGQSSLGDTYNF